jgi:hypothetical protein
MEQILYMNFGKLLSPKQLANPLLSYNENRLRVLRLQSQHPGCVF